MATEPAPAAERPITLVALVRRREGTTREEFLHHWRHVHGPLIRDTPGLADRVLRYEQHAAREGDRSGWDGVAIQRFASWQDFLAMLSGPDGDAMRADEANFLDPDAIRVVFTDDPVVVIDRAGADPAAAGDDGSDA